QPASVGLQRRQHGVACPGVNGHDAAALLRVGQLRAAQCCSKATRWVDYQSVVPQRVCGLVRQKRDSGHVARIGASGIPCLCRLSMHRFSEDTWDAHSRADACVEGAEIDVPDWPFDSADPSGFTSSSIVALLFQVQGILLAMDKK